MAKKIRKILPKIGASDRPIKSDSKKPTQKKAYKSIKSKKKSKTTKKTSSKSLAKNKKSAKALPKKGGFSKNNFNVIRSILWQNYREDFTSYFDESFIRTVRELFNDCKQAGVNCSEEVIKRKYEELKVDDKRPKPYILPHFLSPCVYYEIKDVPFATFSPYLYVMSPMILGYPHEFRVTEYFKKRINDKGVEELDLTGYDKFFSNWVNWCNASMREEHGGDYGSEELEIYFKLSDAEYNESEKRWETYIYTCTPSGVVFDFGYKPENELEKDFEPEYRLPSDEKLIEKPITEKEKVKIKRITKKQKINDALGTWNNFFSTVKKSSAKEDIEKYAKELSDNKESRKELEKVIRKYKREKNEKMLKKVNKEYDALTKKYLALLKKNKK